MLTCDVTDDGAVNSLVSTVLSRTGRIDALAASLDAGEPLEVALAASVAALALPGHDPRRYWRHVTATLRPDRGEGLREAAIEHNRGRRL